MAPEGPVAPSGPPRPDLDSRELSEHFRSRARLCRLLVGLRPPTLQRSLRSLRQGGFALYVRLRHYRSSLFCCRKIIPSHSFAALTALVVRRIKGFGDQPSPCLCWTPHAPRRGIGRRTRQRHLVAAALTALIVRRVSGHGGQPMPACTSRRATPKGVERAPGSGTLPPAAISILQIYYSLYYDKENRKCQDAGKKFSEFSESEKKKPGPMPRRIAVALRESAVYFTRKAVSAVCPAIRSSTVTCQ